MLVFFFKPHSSVIKFTQCLFAKKSFSNIKEWVEGDNCFQGVPEQYHLPII